MVVVLFCLISVSYYCREISDQIYGLSEHILDRCIVRIHVVAVKSKYAPCDLVHDARRRRCQYHVSCESLWKLSLHSDQSVEFIQLLLCRKESEIQKERDLLKAKAVLIHVAVDKILYVIAAVIQFPVCRYLVLFIVRMIADNFTDLCQSDNDTGTVCVTQTALNIVFWIESALYFINVLKSIAHFSDEIRFCADRCSF